MCLSLNVVHCLIFYSNTILRQYRGVHISPEKRFYVPTVCAKLEDTNISDIFGDQNGVIKGIAVYSTPLTVPFRSSTPSMRERLQLQFFPVDYHAFVVFEADYGLWYSLERMPEGIYLQKGDSRDSVVFCHDRNERPEPVSRLAEDKSDSSVKDVFDRVRHIMVNKSGYDIIQNNCQHFAKEMFWKFAKDKTWEPTTISDVTSPINLFNKKCSPLIVLMMALAFLGELYFLYSHHHEFAIFTTLLVVFVCIGFKAVIKAVIKAGETTVLSIACIIYFLILPLFIMWKDDIDSDQGVSRKRLIEYCEEGKSANLLFKILISICYGTVYFAPACVYCVIIPLWFPCGFKYLLLDSAQYPHLKKISDGFNKLFDMTSVYFFCSIVTSLYVISSC